jgi:hypothetical protein
MHDRSVVSKPAPRGACSRTTTAELPRERERPGCRPVSHRIGAASAAQESLRGSVRRLETEPKPTGGVCALAVGLNVTASVHAPRSPRMWPFDRCFVLSLSRGAPLVSPGGAPAFRATGLASAGSRRGRRCKFLRSLVKRGLVGRGNAAPFTSCGMPWGTRARTNTACWQR